MIELRNLHESELELLGEMDRDSDTSAHITVYSLAEHQREYARDDIIYLAICSEGKIAGYFMLRLEDDADSVEFRRIVVAQKGKGIGQAAISAMETWCVNKLQRRRIWLDVFKSNPRGQHIYCKLGYRPFKSGELRGRPLIFMQKIIDRDASSV